MRSLKKSIGSLDGELATRLISAATDIALVINEDGIVQDVSVSEESLSRGNTISSWIGRSWIDTVSDDSRSKVEAMLRDASAKIAPRWRQVNHPWPEGQDLPIRYSALNLDTKGRILAVGRELRSVSEMQQRLVHAQQSMEREYARVRLAETRYRLLFQMASEAVVITDTFSLKITELNPAADRLFGKSSRRKVSKSLYDFLEPASALALQSLVRTIKSTGGTTELLVELAGSKMRAQITGSLFRQDASSFLLLRITPVEAISAAPPGSDSHATLRRVVDGMPDGFVVIDSDRNILTANTAFLDLAQIAAEDQVRDQPIEHWLGRSSIDLNTLIANTIEHGSVRQFSTIARGQYGAVEDVEVSAVHVADGEQPCFGLTIRSVRRPVAGDSLQDPTLPRSVKQLTNLVGQVPLKDLVRESTDLIERLCIEAALELVGDNRASAAEMLGLSRQSLYVKLRRYGLGDLNTGT